MENVVQTRLQSVQFGEAQTYKNITILPLIAPADGTFQYRTLGEALATWDIAITEVSAAGSVPDLMVVNRANKPESGSGSSIFTNRRVRGSEYHQKVFRLFSKRPAIDSDGVYSRLTVVWPYSHQASTSFSVGTSAA